MFSGCFGRNSKRKTEQAVRQVTKQTEKEGQQAGNRKTDFRLLFCNVQKKYTDHFKYISGSTIILALWSGKQIRVALFGRLQTTRKGGSRNGTKEISP